MKCLEISKCRELFFFIQMILCPIQNLFTISDISCQKKNCVHFETLCALLHRCKRGVPAGGSQGAAGRRQPAAAAAPHRGLPGQGQQRCAAE